MEIIGLASVRNKTTGFDALKHLTSYQPQTANCVFVIDLIGEGIYRILQPDKGCVIFW